MAIYMNGEKYKPYFDGAELWQLLIDGNIYYQAKLKTATWSVTFPGRSRQSYNTSSPLVVTLPPEIKNGKKIGQLLISGGTLKEEIIVDLTPEAIEAGEMQVNVPGPKITRQSVRVWLSTGMCTVYPWSGGSSNPNNSGKGKYYSGLTESQCDNLTVPGYSIGSREWSRSYEDKYSFSSSEVTCEVEYF